MANKADKIISKFNHPPKMVKEHYNPSKIDELTNKERIRVKKALKLERQKAKEAFEAFKKLSEENNIGIF